MLKENLASHKCLHAFPASAGRMEADRERIMGYGLSASIHLAEKRATIPPACGRLFKGVNQLATYAQVDYLRIADQRR